MKFYISSRTSQSAKVQNMIEVLEGLGHECTYNWTLSEGLAIQRPFQDNNKEVGQYAEKEIVGAKEADVFIIIGDVSGTGMYVEMGAALSSGAKIYAIGEHNDVTVFHFHPNVLRLDTFEDMLKNLGI